MKIKLIAFVFTILSFMSLQAVQATSSCLEATDIYVGSSHECVYCPTTLAWGETGLTCAAAGKCDHGTDVNASHTNWCDYCSNGFTFNGKECAPSPKQSKQSVVKKLILRLHRKALEADITLLKPN